MRKIKYMIFITAAIALSLFIFGAACNGFNQLETLYDRGELGVSLPYFKTKTTYEEFSDIKKLEIKCETGTVNLFEYDGTVIKVEALNITSQSKIKKDNDTLVIKGGAHIFNFISSNDSKINVYIPRDYYFEKAEIDVDAGKVTVDKLNVDKLDFNVDLGALETKYLKSDQAKLDVDAGSIEVAYLDSQDSELKCDLGDIDVLLAGKEMDYNIDAKCDLGDITIGNYDGAGISESYQKHDGSRKLKAKCDLGKITIRMEGE